jgi:hypothetical protein
MTMLNSIITREFLVLTGLVTAFCLSACDTSTTVDVNLHGVNYSNQTFSYYVKDPSAKENTGGGGELIDRYAGGGTTCCVKLPKIWRPGIKLQVNTTYWLKKRPDGEIPEFKETYIVEVPSYMDGKPGELWILRASDGGISVVSSDFQPDHPKWPGKTKGWPEPSLEYRTERWKIILDHEEGGVSNAISLLKELETDPLGHAKRSWEFEKEYDAKRIKEFFGPNDPKYIIYLRKSYEEGLEYSRGRVKQVMQEKP